MNNITVLLALYHYTLTFGEPLIEGRDVKSGTGRVERVMDWRGEWNGGWRG